MKSILTRNQKKEYTKNIQYYGKAAIMKVEIRYDDECKNGHNSFAITGEIRYPGYRDIETGGCIHEEIVKHFPELAKYIRWHLFNSTGPMYYLENTLYLAGDRDCSGYAKGEISSWDYRIQFGEFPITFDVKKEFRAFILSLSQEQKEALQIIPVEHKPDTTTWDPKFTFSTFPCEWYQCPFDDETEGKAFLSALIAYPIKEVKTPSGTSQGKARELDAARNSACWPEATDEQLSLPKEELKKLLLARLPKLIKEFKKDLKELELVY